MRNALRLLALLSLTLTSTCMSQGLAWKSLGPQTLSGPIRHLLLDPINPHRLYAASENGGIWYLADVRLPELGWKPLSDKLENLQMRGVAKSTLDPKHILAANALGFVYQTLNHGQTWSRVGEQNFGYVRKLVMADRLVPAPPGVNILGGPTLAKETRVWVASQTGLHLLRMVNGVLVDTRVLYPVSTSAIAQVGDVLDALVSADMPEIFVAAREQGVWRKSLLPGGPEEPWELVVPWSSFVDPSSSMIKFARTNDGNKVVVKLGRTVLASEERGAASTWQPLRQIPFSDTGGNDIGYRGNYSGKRGEWTHAIAVSSADLDSLAVGQQQLFVTNNGGKSRDTPAAWAEADPGHEDIQALVFSEDGKKLYVGNDGGVFQLCKGTSPSAQVAFEKCPVWDLNDGLVTAQFYRAALNGKQLVANADHQGVWGSVDVTARPTRWLRGTRKSSGFGVHGLENDFVSADPAIAARFYLQFEAKHLLRLRFPPTKDEDLLPLNSTEEPLQPFTQITNKGAVYSQLNYGVGTVVADTRANSRAMLVSVHVEPDRSFGVKLTTQRGLEPKGGPRIDNSECDPVPVGGCFKTPVSGTPRWTTVLGPVSEPLVSLVFSRQSAGIGFALDQSGAVYELTGLDSDSPRGSVATRAFSLPEGEFARQIVEDPREPGRLLAIADRELRQSDDGRARVWAGLGASRLPSGRLQAIAFHPRKSNILFVGTDMGLWVSLDRGSSWADAGNDLPRVNVMQVLVDATHVYAVTFGRGLWAAPLTD